MAKQPILHCIDNVNAAVEVKLLAERKAGALLAGMELHGGDRGNQHTGGKVALRDLGSLGITKIQSHRWQKLAGILTTCEIGRIKHRPEASAQFWGHRRAIDFEATTS